MSIEEYLIKTIEAIPYNITKEELRKVCIEVCDKLCENKGFYGYKDDLYNRVFILFYNYQNKAITKDKLIECINNEVMTTITGASKSSIPISGAYNNSKSSSSSNKQTNTTKQETKTTSEKSSVKDDRQEKNTEKEKQVAIESNSQEKSTGVVEKSVTVGKDVVVDFKKSKTNNLKSELVSDPPKKSVSAKEEDIIVDVDVEEVNQAASKYEEIIAEVEEIAIDTQISDSSVSGDVAAISDVVEEVNGWIEEDLEAINEELVDIVEEIVGIDDLIEEVDLEGATFSDITRLTASWKANTTLVKVDESFFRRCGYPVDNGVVTVGSFAYSLKTGKLSDKTDGTSIYVDYYVPQSCLNDTSKLSKTNTITCLAASKEDSVGYGTGYGNITNITSDSIVILPSKRDLVSSDRSYSTIADQVMDTTEFAKQFSSQQSGCHNIIGGCSNGGGSALKIASQSDLYDEVFSINYPALIPGIDASKGYSTDRIDALGVEGLSNKTILFISSSGDANKDLSKESVRLLRENNSNVYWTTNASVKEDSANGILDSSYWKTFATDTNKTGLGRANGEYSGHPSYHGLLDDVITSGMFDKNGYNYDFNSNSYYRASN